jgi:hypothetical protein
MSAMPESLVEAVRNRTVILFVGAGVSKNLKLPDWSELIAHMAEDLGYDAEVFTSLGDQYSLAEYYVLCRGSIGPLRSYMDVHWHRTGIKIGDSEVHHLIVRLGFPIIYTTNYDRWLELAFDHYQKPCHVITGVRDLVNVSEKVTQVVKFHGDFTDDSSIVLTESSYFERLGFETSLDIKLRSDVLGRTILFVGYSMSDINMRYLFYKLNKLWSATDHRRTRPKSYVFLQKTNPVQALVLENRGITPIFSASDDPGEGLRLFLKELYAQAYGCPFEGAPCPTGAVETGAATQAAPAPANGPPAAAADVAEAAAAGKGRPTRRRPVPSSPGGNGKAGNRGKGKTPRARG